MLVVVTEAPLWTGALRVVIQKLVSLGLLREDEQLESPNESFDVLCEPSASPGTNVDDDAEQDSAARHSCLVFSKEVARAMVHAASSIPAKRRSPLLLLFVSEWTHSTQQARRSLLTHIAAFFHREQGRHPPSPHTSTTPQYLWLSAKWWCGPGAVAPSVESDYRSRRSSWLSGWLYGSFALEEALLSALYGSARREFEVLRAAKGSMERLRSEKLADEEELPPTAVTSPSTAEGWSAALTISFSPLTVLRQLTANACPKVASPRQQLPLFIVYDTDAAHCQSSDRSLPCVGRVLQYLHQQNCYPVVVCYGASPWKETPLPSTLARCGVPFTVAQLATAVVTDCRASLPRTCGAKGLDEAAAQQNHLLRSNFGIAALVSATLHFLAGAVDAAWLSLTPALHNGLLWLWCDPQSPPFFVVDGPFQLVDRTLLCAPSSGGDTTSSLVELSVVGQGGRDDTADALSGADSQALIPGLRYVLAPKTWAASWTRCPVSSTVVKDLPFSEDGGLLLAGQRVCFSVLRRETPDSLDESSEAQVVPKTGLALLLPCALRVVSKELMDKAGGWLREKGKGISVSFYALAQLRVEAQAGKSTPLPPVLHVTLVAGSDTMPNATNGKAQLVLWNGNIASATCACGGAHSPSEKVCIHVAALCALCCETVLCFSHDSTTAVVATATATATTATAQSSDGAKAQHFSTRGVPNTVLGPSGLPLFMMATGSRPTLRAGTRARSGAMMKAERGEAKESEAEVADKAASAAAAPRTRKETAFFCFARLQRADVARRLPGASSAQIARALGAAWKSLSTEEKEAYRTRCLEHAVDLSAQPRKRTRRLTEGADGERISGTQMTSSPGRESPSGRKAKADESPGKMSLGANEDGELFQQQNPEWYRDAQGEWRCAWDDSASDDDDGGNDVRSKSGGGRNGASSGSGRPPTYVATLRLGTNTATPMSAGVTRGAETSITHSATRDAVSFEHASDSDKEVDGND